MCHLLSEGAQASAENGMGFLQRAGQPVCRREASCPPNLLEQHMCGQQDSGVLLRDRTTHATGMAL